MKEQKIAILCVQPGSIAEEVGIEAGDVLLSVNGEKIKDIFDYRFQTTNEELVLEIQKGSGEIWEIEIEKDEYEDIGLEFESSMLDEAKSCTNKCIFCFIDQLPEGMRNTLYFKDDDSRLSFLTGNYVTLTNISYEDIDRIIRYKMSPINVSVHTTNPDLRVFMLKNRHAGNVVEKIEKLTAGGITVNCQIVLCRHINDEMELERTLADLTQLYPGVYSISIVPVGLTGFREGLSDLVPYDKESSAQVIDCVEKWQNRLMDKYGSRIVYIADEFYLMAEKELPGYKHYEDFPQIENGVGLVAQLKHEVEEYLEDKFSFTSDSQKRHKLEANRCISIATGVSAYDFIGSLAKNLEERFEGLKIDVYKISNHFFGERITVTGLLTGQDIAAQLKEAELGEELLLCRSMFKAGEEVFLDDYTLQSLSKELGKKVVIVENSGKDFVDKITGGDDK